VDLWKPVYIVIDATGVGAGISSFFEKRYPGKVIPFVFSTKSKSDLGWNYLAVIDTGRFKDHEPNGPERAEFWRQLDFVQYEAGENKVLHWSVPNGSRDPATGELVHDDCVLSASLCAVLDQQPWSVPGESLVIHRRDPLAEMDEEGF
jgi:hypothetical protein